MKNRVLFYLIAFFGQIWILSSKQVEEPRACYNKFEYEYNVLQKLVIFEQELKTQGQTNDKLKQDIKGAHETIRDLRRKLDKAERSLDGSTYTRWGRTVCPTGASKIYDGFVGGGHYTHSGSGVNYLCLPSDPLWGQYTEGFQSADRVYGTEYHTSDYASSKFKNLNANDAPCVVCRVPRNNVLMIPGRNQCYQNYTLEYSGYLMAGHYSHAGASEYVCVDAAPEATEAGHESKSEKFFFFVEASCGVLKCPPYVNQRELTCAVCSYSPSM